MVGRTVRARNVTGIVIRWEPLGEGMCDTLLKYADGREVWHSSAELKPAHGGDPLPSRRKAREQARRSALTSLRTIRAQHVRDFSAPWPGAEFGKAIIGQAIDGAINALERKD